MNYSANLTEKQAPLPERDTIESFLRDTIRYDFHLAYIPEGQPPLCQWFGDDATAAADWAVAANERGHNVYFTFNRAPDGFNRKPSASDIIAARFAFADIDPPKDGQPFDIEAHLDTLENDRFPPSFVIASGGGLQAYWRIEESENLAAIAELGIGIAHRLNADSCGNVDRLARLPGTVNYPNEVKRARGRRPSLAYVERPDSGQVYEPSDLAAHFPAPADKGGAERANVALPPNVELLTLDGLGLADSILRRAIHNPKGNDRNGDVLHAAAEMVRCGFSDAQAAGILLNPENPVSAHCIDQCDSVRAARRAIEKARADEGIAEGAVLYIGEWQAMSDALLANWQRKHGTASPANDNVMGLVATKGVTARALLQMDFPPVSWIVPGIAPEGLTILAGAPKVGKSWLALGIAVAVAEGSETLGGIACDPGRVLYLALEDNRRRLAGRLKAMGCAEGSDRLDLMTEWPSLDENCIDEMERWADDHADARLVVVDVFAKVKGERSSNRAQYEQDYKDVSKLQRFAIERGIGLIIVHHTRKQECEDPFDAVSGTRGLTGSADSTIVLTKGFGGQQPGLYGRGRDIEEFEKQLIFDSDKCRWFICGNIIAPAASPEQREILGALEKANEPMSLSEIAGAVDKSPSNVAQMLGKLEDAGRVIKPAYGKYAIARLGNPPLKEKPTDQAPAKSVKSTKSSDSHPVQI